MAKAGSTKRAKLAAGTSTDVVPQAPPVAPQRSLVADIQQSPLETFPKVLTRCSELARELVSTLKLGIESTDEAADKKSRWNDIIAEFCSIVSVSKRWMDSWAEVGLLSADAAEALLEARNMLFGSMTYPARIDPGKRQFIEPLERFLKLTTPKKPRGGKKCEHCIHGWGYVTRRVDKGRVITRYYKCEKCGKNWPLKTHKPLA